MTGLVEASSPADDAVEALVVEHQRDLVDARASTAEMTAFDRDVAQQGDLPLQAVGDRAGRDRQTMTSGWMPRPRSSVTECWVGLVFCSPEGARYGTRVRWT